MSGAANVLSGFVQLTVPPTQLELNEITTNSHPVSISFAPRTTVPELQGNMILDSTDISTNTCTYKGNVYELVDIQICSVTNKGYLYPGNPLPVAELIITFAPKQNSASTKTMDGILLCVPIYDNDTPNHNEYLMQLIDPNMPACNYTNNPGTRYTGGNYRQGDNSSLVNCVKSCCDDPNCISYNFNGGQCSLNNMVSESTTAGEADSSGTINRGAPAHNTGNRTAITPTLQSIFYNSNVDSSQTSIAYITTFDTVTGENRISSTKTLFIAVFPVGIRMAPAAYQQLILQMRSRDPSQSNPLLAYRIPLRVRNYESTVVSFTYDQYGNKVPSTTSNKGEISTIQFGSCDERFKNHYEWFTKPPLVISKSTASFKSEKNPYYKTSQYKCVPFDQLHDLSGNPQDAYIIPGNTSLQDILNKKQTSSSHSASADNLTSTDDIIDYSAYALVGIVGFYILWRIGNEINKNF